MKKLLLSIFALSAYVSINAQCNELFISEYVEGTGNDKALEIYNPSNNAISLNNNYRLVRFANGNGEAQTNVITVEQIGLGTHVIPAHHTWVIVLDQRNPNGTGQTIPVSSALQMKADTFLCPSHSQDAVMYFNGNDGLGLQKTADGGSTWADVDIFAEAGNQAMGSNDGSGGWCSVYPYNCLYESAWTYNHTLIRKHTVMQGTTINPGTQGTPTFNVSDQWDSLPNETIDSLGFHRCDCTGPAGIQEYNNSVKVAVFPNPVNDSYFNVLTSEPIELVQVYDVMGREILNQEGNKTNKGMLIETGALSKGVYIVRISCINNKRAITKLTIQ